jgi:RHS repeat-associated protein
VEHGSPQCRLAGQRQHRSGIASRQPLRYASYTFDEQSGLYYCSQRYYDPAVAAFISKDPARADGEESAYQYCGGDPVGKTDPSGLWVWIAWHRVTQKTHQRDLARHVAYKILRSVLQGLALAAAPGPYKAFFVPASEVQWAYDVLEGIRFAGDMIQVVTEQVLRPGDLLILQRSSYAYHQPSCHDNRWWTFKWRWQIQRKTRGRWRTVSTDGDDLRRLNNTRFRAPASYGALPVYVGWPRRVTQF